MDEEIENNNFEAYNNRFLSYKEPIVKKYFTNSGLKSEFDKK